MKTEFKIIAHIYTNYKGKFGIPRQSGLVLSEGKIVFEPEYRNNEAVRGLESFSHIWIIWNFSKSVRNGWSPTVRPPRLGGNKKMGVFATRSPFRPNEIGLSSVKLKSIEFTKDEGPVIYTEGADMADGTPIFDIKPYITFTDNHPDAVCGFADEKADYKLEVDINPELTNKIPKKYISDIYAILENDPRPSYQNDIDRIYGMNYADMNIKFTVSNGVARVCEVVHEEIK